MATGYEDFENRMRKTSENLITNLSSVRAGRANAAVLDQISVDYYGVPTPIQQLANISSPGTRARSRASRRPSWPRTWASTRRTTAFPSAWSSRSSLRRGVRSWPSR